MRTLYDPIEPYATGLFDVGDGHRLYFQRCGTPGAKPVVFLHGGPGGGITPANRRLFNPKAYDILLFDQRGCGRSTPHASLDDNTTWHLVADIERLRAEVGVDRWQVLGGSWGATLALTYAQSHPDRVTELVLRGIFLLSEVELDWYYQHGASMVFPEHWEAFVAPIPVEERQDLRGAYRRRLTGSDPVEQLQAARAWSLWEGRTISLLPDPSIQAGFEDPRFALSFARIENHFFHHGGWLEDGQLLRDADRLRGIPGTIVHGRYDMVCPARSVHLLHRAWPGSELRMVDGAGHAWTEPGILDCLIEATDHYSRR